MAPAMVPAVSQFSTVHSKSKIAKRMHAQDPDDKLVCCNIQFSRLCSSYCLVQAVAAAAALVLAGMV